jgi:hypothetical protein
MDDFIQAELQIELEALRKEINKLKEENDQLKQIIVENDLEDQIGEVSFKSPEQKICEDGIKHLATLFENGTFDKNDAANFDILHKNLRLIRGQSVDTKSKKTKKADVKELLKIVEGTKND